LIAEKAVLMARAVQMAGDQAPHGKGLFCLEQAVLDHGRELLRMTLERSISARSEAQKKGSAGCPAAVAPSSGIEACGHATC